MEAYPKYLHPITLTSKLTSYVNSTLSRLNTGVTLW